MKITDLTWQMIVLAVAVLFLLIELYNKFSSAKSNHERYVQKKNEPIEDIRKELDVNKARLDNHDIMLKRLENDTNDTKKGLNAIGKGVQALLEHEMHGGNDESMASANDGINQWLWDGRE